MLNLPRYGFAAPLLMVLLVGILKSSATEIPASATASQRVLRKLNQLRRWFRR
jgi:hypothetical protein